MHIDKPQSFRENVLWIDETKLKVFGKSHQLYVHRCKNQAYKERCTWHVPGCPESVRGTMQSQDYQGILEWNVLPSVRKLGLSCRSWALQWDNPKHMTQNTQLKNTQEWLRAKLGLFRSALHMSPDLNPIEHLWKELKHAEGTLHTWDRWSSLLARSGPKYMYLYIRCRSVRELQKLLVCSDCLKSWCNKILS